MKMTTEMDSLGNCSSIEHIKIRNFNVERVSKEENCWVLGSVLASILGMVGL